MADLFRSHYEMGSQRRGVEDGETLWALLAEDGTINIVDDPTGAEVESAQGKLSKLDLEDPEVRDDPETKALIRTVNFQPPAGTQAPEEEAEEDEAEKKDDKKATGR